MALRCHDLSACPLVSSSTLGPGQPLERAGCITEVLAGFRNVRRRLKVGSKNFEQLSGSRNWPVLMCGQLSAISRQSTTVSMAAFRGRKMTCVIDVAMIGGFSGMVGSHSKDITVDSNYSVPVS